jgi:hypothetical protein
MRWFPVGLFCFPLLLSLSFSVMSAEKSVPITLATNIPSAFTSDDTLSDESPNVSPYLECIFHELHSDYSVQVMPWRRAYQDVKNNRIDGFFTAIPMRQIDPYADLSAPLILENWYWFWRNDIVAPESWRQGYKLGSILGSQQETWLEEAGYTIDMSANNLPQLIKLLNSKRIDVVLADHDHFLKAVSELGIDPAQFQLRFFRYVPLGVYFNAEFLNQNPEFMSAFNEQISNCATVKFTLSEFEKETIKALLMRKIERWRRLPNLESLLVKRNKISAKLSMSDINKKDKQWRAAFKENDFSYFLTEVDQAFSAQLRELKKQSQEMITEVIITDARGLNFAVSDMTSDYWQGDEEKFRAVFAQPINTVHFGDINYDESTKHFQVHLSVPLAAEKTQDPLGVLVLGIDIEKVLSVTQ